MRALFTSPVVVCALLLSGCFGSHGDEPDGGERSDSSTTFDGSVGTDGGSGSDGGIGTTDGATTTPADASLEDAGLDLIGACIDACDHLVSCHPMFDRVECVADCLETREWLSSPECETLAARMFVCVGTLPCSELTDRDIAETTCGSILVRLEDACGGDEGPDDPPPPAE